MRYAIALLLVACSTPVAGPDAYVVDAGPLPDAEPRTCELECVVQPSCSSATCVPMYSWGSAAFCAGCEPHCATGAPVCLSDGLIYCGGAGSGAPLATGCSVR